MAQQLAADIVKLLNALSFKVWTFIVLVCALIVWCLIAYATRSKTMCESQLDDQNQNQVTKDELRRSLAETEKTVAEGRLKLLLALGAAFLTVFGVAIPLLITMNSSDKTDRAVDRMDQKMFHVDEKLADLSKTMDAKVEKLSKDIETKFEKLFGEQLRKPDIECYLQGKELNGAVMHLKPNTQEKKLLYITNKGNRQSPGLKLVFYTKKDLGCSFGRDFDRIPISDEAENGFKFKFSDKPMTDVGDYIKVEAGDTETLELKPLCKARHPFETAALLKVYYGEPEPKRFFFTIKSVQKEKK